MPDLLLELFSEEIPARMQAQAAKDLELLVAGALSDRGLLFEGIKAFAGPRRLTLAVAGLPAKQPDVSEEIKGPKVDAPALRAARAASSAVSCSAGRPVFACRAMRMPASSKHSRSAATRKARPPRAIPWSTLAA